MTMNDIALAALLGFGIFLYIRAWFISWKTSLVVHFLGVMWFCIIVILFKPAHSAEATLNMQSKIISYADTVEICQADQPPHWCPEHLRKEKQPITQVQFDYALDRINEGYALDRIEPASGDEVYE